MIVKHNGSPIVLSEQGTTTLLITKSDLSDWPKGSTVDFVKTAGIWYYRKQWEAKVDRLWGEDNVDFNPLTLAFPVDPDFTLDKLDELL